MSNKVPQIRFNGYSDAWEERKLGDEFKKVSERNDGSFGRNHWISVAKMYFQRPEKVQSNNIDTRTYVMREGDIAFEGHPNSEFKFGRFVANDIGAGVVSELFPIYRHQHEYDNNYWKNAIQIERTMAPIFAKSITSSGNSSNKLDTKHFLRQKILIPQINEQKKIGSFFKQLDDTIALHQRKLDLLKEQKKGYLQKMFPKNGAKVPELRFAGFADDWEERQLGEISRMYQPITITGNDLLPDGVPVFGANGFIGFFSEANHIDDQVTISARGEGSGTPSYVHGPVWITGNSMVVNVDDFHIDKYFLFANLTANSLKKFVTGGAQPQLTRDVLVKVPITLPNADEQQKIGSFFKQLDGTIALHQRKLDLLKEQKKGYLQKIFV